MTDPILCHECGHDIRYHTSTMGCSDYIKSDALAHLCRCQVGAASIARAYGEKRFHEGWDACELRWAVGHSE